MSHLDREREEMRERLRQHVTPEHLDGPEREALAPTSLLCKLEAVRLRAIEVEARLHYEREYKDYERRVAWGDTTDGIRELHREAVVSYVTRIMDMCAAAREDIERPQAAKADPGDEDGPMDEETCLCRHPPEGVIGWDRGMVNRDCPLHGHEALLEQRDLQMEKLAEGIVAACEDTKRPDAEALARRFHEIYERLAPEYGYRTRESSAVPWVEVPDANRSVMVAVCRELLGSVRDTA